MSCSVDGGPIFEETLRLAKESAYKDPDENVFKAMLRPLSNADVAFLEAMSVDDGATRTGGLAGRLGVTQGHVQSYRRRLFDAGVICAPRRGKVEFVIPRPRQPVSCRCRGFVSVVARPLPLPRASASER